MLMHYYNDKDFIRMNLVNCIIRKSFSCTLTGSFRKGRETKISGGFGLPTNQTPRLPGWSISPAVIATSTLSTSSTFEPYAEDNRLFDALNLFDHLLIWQFGASVSEYPRKF